MGNLNDKCTLKYLTKSGNFYCSTERLASYVWIWFILEKSCQIVHSGIILVLDLCKRFFLLIWTSIRETGGWMKHAFWARTEIQFRCTTWLIFSSPVIRSNSTTARDRKWREFENISQQKIFNTSKVKELSSKFTRNMDLSNPMPDMVIWSDFHGNANLKILS